MGQRLSKEIARLDEISDEKRKNFDRLHTLFPLAADEAAAGKPATPGSHQARRDAAWAYSMQLSDESNAILARLIAKGEGRSLPMPDPTPPLVLPPPRSAPDAAPASAAGEQPATPIGSASTPTRCRLVTPHYRPPHAGPLKPPLPVGHAGCIWRRVGSPRMSDVRALVLTPQDRGVIVSRLARAVLSFQDNFLSRESSPSGLLCQVWLPEVADGNEVVLKTKGLPFCVAGMGDLLALFRCISCRFAFGTDVARPTSLGAPGRVYTSSEPEMCCNVQQYAKQEYLRKAEAQQCQVQSTLLLPLFISPRRSGCVGVLEVVQTSQDMAFGDVAALLAASLERCELYTCDMEAVKRRIPDMTTSTLLLPPVMGVLEEAPTDGEAGQGASDRDSGQRAGGGGEEAMADAAAAGGAVSRKGSGMSDDFSADEDDDDDDEEYSGARRRSTDRRGGASSSAAGRSRRKGAGNPGKPGVRLTLADLQSQFGVGLKEAAARLGICPTTLKRACRRHGIQRWPRRQLQKVNRALDELEARQMLQPHQHLLGTGAAAAAAAGGGFAPGAGPGADGVGGVSDNRWTTLAHFMPAYQSTADTMQGYADGQQFGGNLLPFSVTVQQTDPGANQRLLLQQQQQQAQQQQQLYLQQAAAAAHAAAAQRQAAAYAAASGQPAASGLSLPDGALALGGGGGVLPQVPAMSGVSTLGQPPPQQAQRGAAPPPAGPQAESRKPATSGGSSGGGSKAADYLQRVAAANNLVSPFGPPGAVRTVNPVVQLPAGLAAIHDARRLSAISVPSVDVDVMPPLGAAPGLGDDEQVGFLDSSVLELLLTEEQRAGRANGGGAHTANGGSGVEAGQLGMGSLQVPGLSGGISGLGFSGLM
ncbi:RWP-RK domain-containing transcription factor [Chlorella sorokiniana]|uniref:RWP-RK domain-containing transcription factor n=1 Tax=Chlorella sorokiniana TaxID=3076 RepID=A0A2P6TER3_CHLSO|nr:RWP-RK domain-containing transcription factor [Chlorella sorokiniana]|eukprot:PRW21123.1 RWP-RK domain-containing transcription factor [Chlorella sorokiniana]